VTRLPAADVSALNQVAAAYAAQHGDTAAAVEVRRLAALGLEADLRAERYTTGRRWERAIAVGLREIRGAA
jgi:hypothetical protein